MSDATGSTTRIEVTPSHKVESALDLLRAAGPLAADRDAPLRSCVDALAELFCIPIDESASPREGLLVLVGRGLDGAGTLGLATWILRLLPLCPELEEPSDRVPLARLVQKELTAAFPDGYFERQGHEVIRDLSQVQLRAEQDVESAMMQLQSLDRIGACRQALLQALNKKPNKFLLRPWLPANLDASLGEFFARLFAYAEARGDTSELEAFDMFTATAQSLALALHRADTRLARNVEEGLVRKASALVDNEHRTSPAAQPAKLILSPGNRTYPLHLVGHMFALPVVVTNVGPGFAEEVTLTIVADAAVTLAASEVLIGRLRPGLQERLEVEMTVAAAVSEVALLLQVSWRCFDGTKLDETAELTVRAQRSDINWNRVDRTRAYSLEPVASAQELVGRKDMLARLMSIIDGGTAGSVLLHGQKRVGKTSLAKAVQSQLGSKGYHVLYIESGDYVDPSASVTVRQLGSRICRMAARLAEFVGTPVPSFGDSLAPLADFFDDLSAKAPERRFLVVLDEFDELPVDLYERDPMGNSFFLGIRSLSSRPNVGIMLIGGEKMGHILERQADKLNKFAVVSVDYFRKDRDWEDFRELVERPTEGILDFQQQAVAEIFDATNGNPYFAHLLCKELLQSAFSVRDCVVAPEDVERATRSLVREAERNSFQHFWEDGILDTGRLAADRSVQRRRTLIALADSLRTERPAPVERIQKHPLAGPHVATILQEFSTRGILSGSGDGRVYQFTVPLFDRWLSAHGMKVLLGTFDDLDATLAVRKRDEDARVTQDELRALVTPWATYRGLTVTEAKVEAWLEQFETPRQQRSMFRLLQKLRFFSHSFVRRKMREVDDILRNAVRDRVGARQLSHEEIVVSYLDGPGKSGAATARLLCEERGLPAQVIAERATLKTRLADPKVRVLVLVDDFVGTGEGASRDIRALHDDIAEIARSRDVRTVFVAVVGHTTGMERLRCLAEELRFGLQVHCCETLDASDEVFSEASTVFDSPEARNEAKAVAQAWGARLQKQGPLGYGGLGLAVVFERSCPNNSLPILHVESKSPKWVPLFKRL